MMGSFDVNAKPGSLELTGMASTRMMCPDMTTENNVLNAFAQVKGYKKAGKDKVFLCNSSNRPVVVLQKKEADVINGGFETSTSNAKSISFPGVASTMMACPDMETEGKVLKAINEVKSFDVLSGGGIGLYDANGALVIVLEK